MYRRILSWGIVIYAIMSLVWTGIVTYGLAGTLPSRLVVFGALIAVTLVAGRSLRMHSWVDVLPYSIGWVGMMIAFDSIFTAPLSGFQSFADPNLWLGYLIVGAVPLLAPYTRAPHHDS